MAKSKRGKATPLPKLIQEDWEERRQEMESRLEVPKPFPQVPTSRRWFQVRIGKWSFRVFSSYEEIYELAYRKYHSDRRNQNLQVDAQTVVIIPIENAKYLPN